MIHVVTERDGDFPAKMRTGRFHSTKPFVISTGVTKNRSRNPPTYCVKKPPSGNRESGNRGINRRDAGRRGLAEMSARMPERVYDVGIAEQHLVV